MNTSVQNVSTINTNIASKEKLLLNMHTSSVFMISTSWQVQSRATTTEQATTTDPKLSKDIANGTVDTFIETMQKNLNVRNIEIVDKAKLSYVPSGPNAKKNGVLAAAVGFVLGAGYAVLRYLLDNRLRTKEEAEKYLGIPVFCEIPEL